MLTKEVNIYQYYYEFHMIAANYHWTPEVISALPRSARKRWVKYIEEQLKAMYGDKK